MGHNEIRTLTDPVSSPHQIEFDLVIDTKAINLNNHELLFSVYYERELKSRKGLAIYSLWLETSEYARECPV